MANEDFARIETNSAATSCKAQRHVPQHAHRSARRAQQAASQEPGAARGHRAQSRVLKCFGSKKPLFVSDRERRAEWFLCLMSFDEGVTYGVSTFLPRAPAKGRRSPSLVVKMTAS